MLSILNSKSLNNGFLLANGNSLLLVDDYVFLVLESLLIDYLGTFSLVSVNRLSNAYIPLCFALCGQC